MSNYSQADRPLRITTPLAPDALLLESFSGTEALSRLFEFRMLLLATADTNVPFDKLLGQAATVTLSLAKGETRYFNGIIRSLSQGQAVRGLAGDQLIRYEAVLAPRLWMLTRCVRSRIFQQMTLPDILAAVFAGLEVSLHIQGEFPRRDYCVQYRESDFAFVSRLMEDAGIYYYFQHTESGHALVLSNLASCHPPVPDPAQVAYQPLGNPGTTDGTVRWWRKTQDVCSNEYTLWDYSFELPTQNLHSSESIQSSVQVGTVSHSMRIAGNDALEHYDYLGGYIRRFTGISPGGAPQKSALDNPDPLGRYLARVRMQGEAAAALRISGESTCGQFTAGHHFSLQGHFNADGPYVLTLVEHSATLPGVYVAAEQGTTTFVYDNRFECLPQELPFRPARTTPHPTIAGTQTAVVVGPPGQDVFADRYGRVRVQFFWDRDGGTGYHDSAGNPIPSFEYWPGAPSGKASHSSWVRVAQPWAGGQFGAVALPRVGQEVVVTFLEGNPDAPLIVGGVYNAVQMPPFALPDHQNVTALKSHTPAGHSGNFSGLAIDDTAGAEVLRLHSEKDLTHSAEHTLYTNAGQGHHVNIGQVSTRQVGGLPGINHTLPPPSSAGASSGSGSGGSSGGSSPPFITPTPYGWNADTAGGWATDLSLVLGWFQTNVVGICATNAFGQQVNATFNPFSAFLEMFQPAGFAMPESPLGSAADSTILGGVQDFTVGGHVEITYGNHIEVTRGAHIEICSPLGPLGTGSEACIALAISYMAATAVEMLIPAVVGTSKLATGLTGALGPVVLETLAAIWIGVELSYGEYQVGEDIVALTTAAVEKSIVNNPAAGLAMSQVNTELFNYLVAQGENLGAVNEFPQKLEQHQAAYTVNAAVLCLYATPQINTPFLNPLIAVSATNSAGDLGQVVVQAAQAVSLYGQQSFVQVGSEVSAEDGIILDCGVAGTMVLCSGIAWKPNVITLDPVDGMWAESTLSVVLKNNLNQIILNPATGIRIACGVVALEITEEGIFLTSGATTVKILNAEFLVNTPFVTMDCGDLSVSSPTVSFKE